MPIRPHCAWDALTQAFIGLSSEACRDDGLLGVMYQGILFRLCYQHWCAWKDANETAEKTLRNGAA